MSGLASGVVKVFSSIGSGVAKLGSAVKGVGASLFTGAAANGGSIFGSGGSIFGTGTLGKMFGGASKVTGSVLPEAAGAAGGVSSLTKGIGSFVPGVGDMGAGLAVADTATGFAPAGASAATGGGFLKGVGNWIGENGELVAGALSGFGEASQQSALLEAEQQEAQMNRDFLLAKEMRQEDRYRLDPSVLPGAGPAIVDKAKRPTPAAAYAKARISYDPKTGMIREA